jgi:hypothetical protein
MQLNEIPDQRYTMTWRGGRGEVKFYSEHDWSRVAEREHVAGRAAAWLPTMIRLTAVGYLLFFVPDLILAATHHVHALPPLLARLFDWGGGGPDDQAVAVMFSTVYIVWALFLFGSARAPLANRLFLDFNLTANSAHFGAMLIMAVAMPDQHRHLAGVLALGALTTVPLAACWLPVRRLAESRT